MSKHVVRSIGAVGVGGLLALGGCASSSGRTVRIPESAIARPSPTGKKRAAGLDPYVIKMSDGQRTWQIEIPATSASGAFEAVIPLDLGAADGVAAPAAESPADRDVKAAAGAAASDGPSPSYLSTLAKVNALFRKRQYELALIEITRLDQAYPDDERVLEMKGTLYWRLRKPKLAREAWERVLALNPDNAAVAQALENLLAE